MLRFGWALAALTLALGGCDQAALVDDAGPTQPVDAHAGPSDDAGHELVDAGPMLEQDGGTDSGPEPEPDAGPQCECTSGPCCDGCHFRPATHRCATDVAYEASCAWESRSCPGYSARIWRELADQYCSGNSASCDGDMMHKSSVSSECPDGLYCTGPEGSASCTHVCERP